MNTCMYLYNIITYVYIVRYWGIYYIYDDNESIAAAISRWRTIWVYPGRSIYIHFVAILIGYSHDQ